MGHAFTSLDMKNTSHGPHDSKMAQRFTYVTIIAAMQPPFWAAAQMTTAEQF